MTLETLATSQERSKRNDKKDDESLPLVWSVRFVFVALSVLEFTIESLGYVLGGLLFGNAHSYFERARWSCAWLGQALLSPGTIM